MVLTFPRTLVAAEFLVAGFFAADALAAFRTVGFFFVALREPFAAGARVEVFLAPPALAGFFLGAAGFFTAGIEFNMQPRCVSGKKSRFFSMGTKKERLL